MKNNFYRYSFLIIIFAALNVYAVKAQTPEGDKIYTSVEKPANFPGGLQDFYSFLNHHLHYSGYAHGRIILTFIIEKDGTIDSVKVVRGVSKQADKEAVRVMNKSPKWNPAMIGSTIVRQQYAMPIDWGLSR